MAAKSNNLLASIVAAASEASQGDDDAVETTPSQRPPAAEPPRRRRGAAPYNERNRPHTMVLPVDLIERLNAAVEATGESKAKLARTAIAEYLDAHGL